MPKVVKKAKPKYGGGPAPDSTAAATTAPEVLVLPDLLQPFNPVSRTFETFDVTISDRKLTKDKIIAYLVEYSLPVTKSWKKGQLLDELREFAGDPTCWESTLQVEGGMSTRGNISARRAKRSRIDRKLKKRFGEESTSVQYQPRTIPTAVGNMHDPPALPPATARTNYEWVWQLTYALSRPLTCSDFFLKVQEVLRLDKERFQSLESHEASSAAPFSGSPQRSARGSHGLERISAGPAAPSNASDGTSPASATWAGAPGITAPYESINTPLSGDQIPTDRVRWFLLNGERFPFDKTAVRPPTLVSFAENLDLLFVEWEVSRRLVVNCRGIPIKEWPFFFQSKSGIQSGWRTLKHRWHVWKSLIEERVRHPSVEAFWVAHSNARGERHNQTRILKDLRAVRKDQHAVVARQALVFFHNDLSPIDRRTDLRTGKPVVPWYFRYKKDGRYHVATDFSKITEGWQTLLEDHPDVAAAWRTGVTWPDISLHLPWGPSTVAATHMSEGSGPSELLAAAARAAVGTFSR
ncbi:uncharacterized protein BXZ73DRAFT_102326 [Epithele typhae]|uniref:uncharacterized protein n=1 Tax=Epithele typhae TaxID=378194 RepID=UPI002008A47E|nr:uncharacterized protein BXZ73DRAFT_102326 [Epithele typhae]KAH9928485.1 hypothetical protein BXZ73DRAFT_102326 [Epithele typhae]